MTVESRAAVRPPALKRCLDLLLQAAHVAEQGHLPAVHRRIRRAIRSTRRAVRRSRTPRLVAR
jgi:hypothetical protein